MAKTQYGSIEQANESDNQIYYGVPGASGSANDCNANTTALINTNLFQGSQTSNLEKQKYFFCSFESSTIFINFAKHKEKTCTISLNNKNELTPSNC